MEEYRRVVKTVNDEGRTFKTFVVGGPCTQRRADQMGAHAYA